MASFPLLTRTFDIVHAANAIKYRSDTDLLVAEVHRVLNRLGIIIVPTCNLAGLQNIFFLLLGRKPPPAWVSDRVNIGT